MIVKIRLGVSFACPFCSWRIQGRMASTKLESRISAHMVAEHRYQITRPGWAGWDRWLRPNHIYERYVESPPNR